MQFELGQIVRVREGRLTGTIEGHTRYRTSTDRYLVKHIDKEGFSVAESWFDPVDLEAV